MKIEIHIIDERNKEMSAEFDALKAAVEKLIADFAALKANPPAPDPTPAQIAALTTEVNTAING